MFKVYQRIADIEERVSALETAAQKSDMQQEEIEKLRRRCEIQQSIINKQNERLKSWKKSQNQ